MAPTVPQITAFFCSSGASLPAAIPITTALSPANKISIKINFTNGYPRSGF